MNFSHFSKEIHITAEIESLNFSSITLLIEISYKAINLGLFDNSNHKYVGVISYSVQENLNSQKLAEYIQYLLNEEPFFKKEYKKILISYKSHFSTLIPEELFDENNISKYFEFYKIYQNTDLQIYDKISSLNQYNIYILPDEINNVLKSNLVNYKLINNNTSLITSTAFYNARQVKDSSKNVFINVGNSEFDMVAYNDKQLIINNTFKYKTKEDFIYYLIFALKQIKFETNECQIFLSGKIVIQSLIFKILTKYIKNIDFVEKENFIVLDTVLSNHAFYEYFNLFNLVKCG